MIGHILKNYFGLGIFVTIIAAILFPYTAIMLHPLAILFLFLLMFVTGIRTDWSRLKIILIKKPALILLGNAIIYLIIPAVIYLLAKLLLTTDQYIYGMLFASLAPTAIVAPFFTGLLKGDKELSFGILVSSMIVAPFVIPVILEFLMGSAINIPAIFLFKDMLVIISLPLFLAFFIKKFFSRISKIIYTSAPVLNFIFLSLLVFILFGVSVHKITLGYGDYSELWWILGLFIVQDFGIIFLGRFIHIPFLSNREKTTLIISSSMKNIAIAAGVLLIYDPRAAIAPGIGFIVHAFLFTPWILKKLIK